MFIGRNIWSFWRELEYMLRDKVSFVMDTGIRQHDKGQGIAPEHLSHLTEHFYRVDKGRSQDSGGTGLGLAIVQHIIQRHDGRLDIQSTIGKGSLFSVYSPADRVT